MPMYSGTGHGEDLGEWYDTVQVDVAAAREYARAVGEASLEFISSADDAMLARPIDMSFIGAGSMPLSSVFEMFVVAHLNNLCGEIAAIKGVHGLRGYPF
jgi:hypothetical protein